MNNQKLLNKEFYLNIKPIVKVILISASLLVAISLLLAFIDEKKTVSSGGFALLVLFFGTLYSLKVTTSSFLWRTSLKKEFDRVDVFRAGLSALRPYFIAAAIVVLILNLTKISSVDPLNIAGIYGVELIACSLDLALFASLVYTAFIMENDMAALLLPILPFATVFIPSELQQFVRVGYSFHQLDAETVSFTSALNSIGGPIYIIETIVCIIALLTITRTIFCNKDF